MRRSNKNLVLKKTVYEGVSQAPTVIKKNTSKAAVREKFYNVIPLLVSRNVYKKILRKRSSKLLKSVKN